MGRQILIDTNIAIGYVGNRLHTSLLNKLDKVFDNKYHLSVINKIEMLGYPNLTPDDKTIFNLLINNAILHHIDNFVIQKTIEIKQNTKIKLHDAIIAATCLVHKLDIITLNINDFKNINGLTIVDF